MTANSSPPHGQQAAPGADGHEEHQLAAPSDTAGTISTGRRSAAPLPGVPEDPEGPRRPPKNPPTAYTPISAAIRPVRTAPTNSAWSASVRSA